MSEFQLNYIGHPMLWIYGGLEKFVNPKRLPERIGTNNFIVNLEKLSLSSNYENIIFLPGIKRVYFTKPGNSRTIYSNYFPDSSLERSGVSRADAKRAQMKYEGNTLERLELNNYKIKKLFNTNNHLFALVIDPLNDTFIIKINTHAAFGFLQERYIYNPVSFAAYNVYDIEIVAFEINKYEAGLVCWSKGNRDIFISTFNHTKRAPISFTGILPNQSASPVDLCVFKTPEAKSENRDLRIKPTPGEINLCILNMDGVSLNFFVYDYKTKAFEHKRNLPVKANKHNRIAFFSTQSNVVRDYSGNEFLDFIVLISENEIDVVNLETLEQMPLIGQGNTSINSYIKDKYQTENLNYFGCGPIIKAFAEPETGIFFGDENQMYVLLTSRSRNIWMAKPEQVITNAKNYGNS